VKGLNVKWFYLLLYSIAPFLHSVPILFSCSCTW